MTWVMVKIVSPSLARIPQCENNDMGDAGGHLPLAYPEPRTLERKCYIKIPLLFVAQHFLEAGCQSAFV